MESKFMHPGKLPSSNNPESLEAASSMAASRQSMMESILALIRNAGRAGMTADEVLVATGLTHQTGSARVHDLKVRGLIVPSGARRKTRGGRMAAVMVAAPDDHVIVAPGHKPPRDLSVHEWFRAMDLSDLGPPEKAEVSMMGGPGRVIHAEWTGVCKVRIDIDPGPRAKASAYALNKHAPTENFDQIKTPSDLQGALTRIWNNHLGVILSAAKRTIGE